MWKHNDGLQDKKQLEVLGAFQPPYILILQIHVDARASLCAAI